MELRNNGHRMLLDMSRTVLINLAANYDNVKGLEEIMGGNFIETEASRIFREGEKRGEARGVALGEARGEARKSRQTTINLYGMGLSPEEIASAVEVDITQVHRWIRSSSTIKP